MDASTNALRDIHFLHRRIADLREQLERGPRQVEAKRSLVKARHEALDKAKADLKTQKAHTLQKDSERKGLDARILQLQTQINSAKSNKEYSTLVSEKETVVKARGVVEDEILELMVKEDEVAASLQKAETELKRLEQELAELEKTVSGQTAGLQADLAECESRLKTDEAALPNDSREVYQRSIRGRGADSMVHVSGDTCTGCYTGITPQMHNHLLLNELVLCKSCGRILYLETPPVPVRAG